MTYQEISNAYNSLVVLSNLKLPVKTAYALYKMTHLVKDCMDFCIGEEKKIIDQYGGVIREDGVVYFDGEDKNEKAQLCFIDLDSLHKSQSDLIIEPICISEEDLGEQRITPADIGNLIGFISFV